MDSKKMKFYIMQWMLFTKQWRLSTTEYKNADVFGVNRSKYAVEVEIKVSYQDFMSEVRTIRYIQDGDPRTPNLNKYNKHFSYLVEEGGYNPRPRYFYFAVPNGLREKAIAGTINTPYGLLIVHSDENISYWHRVEEVKKADALTNNKFDDFFYFATKVTFECYRLTKQLRDSKPLPPLEK